MARNRTIIDCYTDEPAGLGVPPFLGVWPRYVAGRYRDMPSYMTIDDLRLALKKYKPKKHLLDPPHGKTNKKLINSTRSFEKAKNIVKNTDQFIFVAGLQTPGKYLSAKPASLSEIKRISKKLETSKILTGPAAEYGSQQYGGSLAEIAQEKEFDEIRPIHINNYDKLQKIALKGAKIIKQIPQRRIIEVETGKGCIRKKSCSFCTEPLKNELDWRTTEQIVEEIKNFMELGATAFRLGKQSCIYSFHNGNVNKLKNLLSGIAKLKPQVFHIDNANPIMIDAEKTKLFCKHLTPGSTAAIGVESFDNKVIRANNLNTNFEQVHESIKTLNKFGAERGNNGCYKLLPGLNILLGLNKETPETLDINFDRLYQIMEAGLLFRRINIRKVVPFPGTELAKTAGDKFLRKNNGFYKNWIKKVRHEIDLPMIKKIFPKGLVIKNLYSEIHDGHTTFLKQLGSYPITVGVKRRLPLGKKFNVKIIDHNPRSLTGITID